MAHLSTERLLFEDIQGNKIEADFDGGQVTSDAGVLLLREVERRLGLVRRIAKIIRDRRHPGYTRHSIRGMLSQRVFQIACGYKDADTLRTDPALKMACDQLPEDEALASQPTLSRLENAVTRTDLYRIGEALADSFIDSYRTPPARILLDIDDTEDTTHGTQQLALFNAYYDEYCICRSTSTRDGAGSSSPPSCGRGDGPRERRSWPSSRGSSERSAKSGPTWASCCGPIRAPPPPEVFDLCRAQNLSFLLGLTPNPILRARAADLAKEAERRFLKERTPVRDFGEFPYRAKSWAEESRVIGKAEHNALGPNTRFVVTNLTTLTPRVVFEKLCCERGTMELFIKDP